MNVTSQQVCDQVLELILRVKVAIQELADMRGITRIQASILHSIAHKGELTMGQLAEIAHCDASNITGLVDRLVAQNLVSRTESQRDRRVKTLRLTAEGQRLTKEIMDALPAALGCSRLSETERRELVLLTKKMLADQDMKLS